MRLNRSVHACAAVVVLLATAALATGCDHDQGPRSTMALWLDTTGSTRADVRLQLREARVLVEAAAHREADLLVERITNNSGNPVWRRFAFRAAEGTAGSPAARKRDLDRQARDAMGPVAQMITAGGRTRGTDILGALASTSQTLAGIRGPREAAFITDMLDSRVLATELRRKPLDRLLTHLGKTGQAPDLRGVDVRFVIGTTNARQNISQYRLINLERFWRCFTAAAHARSIAYQPQVDGGAPSPPPAARDCGAKRTAAGVGA